MKKISRPWKQEAGTLVPAKPKRNSSALLRAQRAGFVSGILVTIGVFTVWYILTPGARLVPAMLVTDDTTAAQVQAQRMSEEEKKLFRTIDHFVITTTRLQDCVDFYQDLGFTAVDGGNRYELFAGNFKINVHTAGAELSPHAQTVQPGSADLCIELDVPLEAFAQRLQEKEIRLEGEIEHKVGARGPMRSLYVRDPDGNLVEFCSYE